jgi:outer membrane protein assembly factor BamB
VLAQDGTIYVGVNSELWAITADGKEKWRRGIEQPIEASPVALSDRSVCFISRNGLLLDLDTEHEPLWSYYVYGYGYACPAISPSGKFYLSERGSQFSAVPAGVPLAKSPWPKFRGNARNTGNISDREP